ncbi:hypothetical protein AB1Y20_014197 [Prymnesium parvum]|uniref:ABC transporter domain-containing protein n=1 Tax=Prymnesium parvum TaxID=97485 RepID=A0AB34IEA8_PRYPA
MPSHSVAWRDISARVRSGKRATRQILHPCAGIARAGGAHDKGEGLLALLGASGSGKTTLLSILAACEPAASGEAALDGRLYDASTGRSIGFVPQAERLFPTLTVGETVALSARLRGAAASRAAEALAALQLEHVQHSRLGDPAASRREGVSGGERRRTAIATELVHRPPLLLLDEPTSGLDSRGAAGVMALLSRLAAEQAVVCSLHQPSARAFAHAAQLCLLSPSGHAVYFGAAAAASEHFASLGAPVPPLTSAPEHLLDAAAELSDGEASLRRLLRAAAVASAAPAAAAAALAAATATPAPPPRRRVVRHAALLFWRSNQHTRRHPAFLRAMVSRSVTMALLIGGLYRGLSTSQRGAQDRVGALYFVLTNQIMTSISSLRTFIAERHIIAHEQRAGMYSLSAYFLARTAAESYVQLLCALLFGGLAYALVGLAPSFSQLALFELVVALVTLVAEAYVVLIGSLMPDEKSASVVAPLGLALFMVTGGLFVNGASVPPIFRWLNAANVFSYGFGALLHNEMRNLTFACEPHEMLGAPPPARLAKKCAAQWPAPSCPVTSGEQVIKRMTMHHTTPTQCILALCALLIAFRAMTFWALCRRFRSPLPHHQ